MEFGSPLSEDRLLVCLYQQSDNRNDHHEEYGTALMRRTLLSLPLSEARLAEFARDAEGVA